MGGAFAGKRLAGAMPETAAPQRKAAKQIAFYDPTKYNIKGVPRARPCRAAATFVPYLAKLKTILCY